MIALLDRVTGWLPWRRQGHVRVCARIPADQWDALFDTAAAAAHELDEELSCSGIWKPSWSIGTVDVGCYRMSRRAVQAVHDRVLTAVRTHQPAPTETAATLCYPCPEEV